MRVLILTAVTGLGCAAALLPAMAVFGPGQLRPAVVAAVICLVPALATLQLVEWVARRAPERAVVAVLVGIGMRMAVVVVGVIVVGDRATDAAARERFVGWVVAMYLLTLAAESVLAAGAVGSAATPTVAGR